MRHATFLSDRCPKIEILLSGAARFVKIKARLSKPNSSSSIMKLLPSILAGLAAAYSNRLRSYKVKLTEKCAYKCSTFFSAKSANHRHGPVRGWEWLRTGPTRVPAGTSAENDKMGPGLASQNWPAKLQQRQGRHGRAPQLCRESRIAGKCEARFKWLCVNRVGGKLSGYLNLNYELITVFVFHKFLFPKGKVKGAIKSESLRDFPKICNKNWKIFANFIWLIFYCLIQNLKNPRWNLSRRRVTVRQTQI